MGSVNFLAFRWAHQVQDRLTLVFIFVYESIVVGMMGCFWVCVVATQQLYHPLFALKAQISRGMMGHCISSSYKLLQDDVSHGPTVEAVSRQVSGSRPNSSRRSLRRNESRHDQPSGYAEAQAQEEEEPKKLSGWAKLRMARRVQGNVKAIQVPQLL